MYKLKLSLSNSIDFLLARIQFWVVSENIYTGRLRASRGFNINSFTYLWLAFFLIFFWWNPWRTEINFTLNHISMHTFHFFKHNTFQYRWQISHRSCNLIELQQSTWALQRLRKPDHWIRAWRHRYSFLHGSQVRTQILYLYILLIFLTINFIKLIKSQ